MRESSIALILVSKIINFCSQSEHQNCENKKTCVKSNVNYMHFIVSNWWINDKQHIQCLAINKTK
jgi:hypothetical protein